MDHSIITNGVIPDPENYVADTFDTGTRSAVAGGTTTVVTFASQMKKDESIIPVIEDYHKLAKGQSYCDYAFHVIITNPTPQIVEDEFPRMVDEYGITSVKLYMTYKPMKLRDYQILDIMYSARKLGITTMVHAENTDIIEWMTQHLEEKMMTHPYHHGTSRPPIVEAEATVRHLSPFVKWHTQALYASESGHLSGRAHGYAYPAGAYIRWACHEAHPRRTDETPSYLR